MIVVYAATLLFQFHCVIFLPYRATHAGKDYVIADPRANLFSYVGYLIVIVSRRRKCPCVRSLCTKRVAWRTAWHPATETRDLAHLHYHVRNVLGRGNIFLRTIIRRVLFHGPYLPIRWIKSHYVVTEGDWLPPHYFLHFMIFVERCDFLAEVVFEWTVAFFTKATSIRDDAHTCCRHLRHPLLQRPPRVQRLSQHINLTWFGRAGRRMIHERSRHINCPLSHGIDMRELQVFVEELRRWALRYVSCIWWFIGI